MRADDGHMETALGLTAWRSRAEKSWRKRAKSVAATIRPDASFKEAGDQSFKSDGGSSSFSFGRRLGRGQIRTE